ncbi:MAG: hypothetical protein HC809_08305 [Gammaproteobacteria bacterium]|nr:hypothetical protein [Gammaproteobacteria bacterium]
MNLPEKIVALHTALEGAALPHAFGGALALAWCTGQARGTIDIDINVFAGVAQTAAVFAALPGEVKRSKQDMSVAKRDGQVRLWWDRTPVDLFFNTTGFHADAAMRTRWESFAGQRIPFLSCNDIAVFKAFFNRTKDWADLEEMFAAGTLDLSKVTAVLIEYLGVDDERIEKLQGLARQR